MENQITYLSTELLSHHPDNPRKEIGDITELTESVIAKGILQNLTVVPAPEGDLEHSYYVVIGNRRLEAARAAGLTALPCVVSDMDYKSQIETMMVENMQREDLTIIEQAQGMQMMLDLGSSLEEISSKTGFSESTVRRRLKLNEYDSKKVVKAQEQGATLADFIKLEEIKSKTERNKLLKVMGTADFNLEFKRSLEEQTINELKKAALKELKTFAEPFPEGKYTWSGEFNFVPNLSYDLKNFKKGKRVPKNKDRTYYYYISTGYRNSVEIYVINPDYGKKAPKKEKSEAEKQTARKVRALKKIAREHYELRKDFIKSLTGRKDFKNYETICLNAFIKLASCYGDINCSYNSKLFNELGIIEEAYFSTEQYEKKLESSRAGTIIATVYRHFEDSDKICYTNYGNYIKFNQNKYLNRIYDFLKELGYQMSTEEIQITDGTHSLYSQNQAEK